MDTRGHEKSPGDHKLWCFHEGGKRHPLNFSSLFQFWNGVRGYLYECDIPRPNKHSVVALMQVGTVCMYCIKGPAENNPVIVGVESAYHMECAISAVSAITSSVSEVEADEK